MRMICPAVCFAAGGGRFPPAQTFTHPASTGGCHRVYFRRAPLSVETAAMSDHVPPHGSPDDRDTEATVATDGPPRPGSAPAAPPCYPRRYCPVRLHARGALGQVHVARDEELNR